MVAAKSSVAPPAVGPASTPVKTQLVLTIQNGWVEMAALAAEEAASADEKGAAREKEALGLKDAA
jgi:hypothetical protein